MPINTICPACNSVWTIEEIEFQECDNCGYPSINDEEEKPRKLYTKPEYNILGRNDDTDD